MGDDGSSQMGFQHSGEIMLNSPSSGMNSRSMALGSGYGSGWDPMVSLGSQTGNFGASSMVTSHGELTKSSSSYSMLMESQGISSSHLANYPSDPNIAHMLPKLSMFGGRNFPEIVGPFGLAGGSQTPNALFPQAYASNKSGLDEKPSVNVTQAERGCSIADGRAVGVSPNGKRKRDSDSPSPTNENTDGDPQKDHSSDASGQKEHDDKKKNAVANSSSKQAGKQVKDNSQGDEGSKQNYIHVRARRGQATNSHSLAERVRREKISERMRLLQELVPGCNKITGKAVMLDEIINYVQSLQQQVEFLSMKLATVNPELNFDIERLLSKDILHSRGNDSSVLGFNQGIGSSHAFSQGIHQSLTAMPNSASQFHHMPPAVWDGDLQSLLHMGFDSNSAVAGLGPNGSSKTEL